MTAPAQSLIPDSKPASALREGVEILKTVGWALLIALALRVFVFQPFTIPSSSMEPGLQIGDYIVVSKFAYGYSRASVPFNPPLFSGRVLARAPKRGDIIVFRLPRDPSQTLIKRLIGLPGDAVQVRGGVVFVNGKAIAQQPLGLTQDHDSPARTVPLAGETYGGHAYRTYAGQAGGEGDDTEVYRAPEGEYFFMGDNRDNSLDSRWPTELGVGFVPAENLVGRAQMVLVSWKKGASVFKPWTWFDLDLGRVLKPLS